MEYFCERDTQMNQHMKKKYQEKEIPMKKKYKIKKKYLIKNQVYLNIENLIFIIWMATPVFIPEFKSSLNMYLDSPPLNYLPLLNL